eukprot:TRINITY_DN25469_c0_g1_i1.p1 TRINITY_DN25469_c0_g1~~TRINITY_DN25469_c0_g1_i1.p1  ORF type:complete len:493 (+),score=74.64 TRINITY_DN25469_c0_g1_i1:198-1676(+)
MSGEEQATATPPRKSRRRRMLSANEHDLDDQTQNDLKVVFSPGKRLQADGADHDAALEVQGFLRHQGCSEEEIQRILAANGNGQIGGTIAGRAAASGKSSIPPATFIDLDAAPRRFADHAWSVGGCARDSQESRDDFMTDLHDVLNDCPLPPPALPVVQQEALRSGACCGSSIGDQFVGAMSGPSGLVRQSPSIDTPTFSLSLGSLPQHVRAAGCVGSCGVSSNNIGGVGLFGGCASNLSNGFGFGSNGCGGSSSSQQAQRPADQPPPITPPWRSVAATGLAGRASLSQADPRTATGSTCNGSSSNGPGILAPGPGLTLSPVTVGSLGQTMRPAADSAAATIAPWWTAASGSTVATSQSQVAAVTAAPDGSACLQQNNFVADRAAFCAGGGCCSTTGTSSVVNAFGGDGVVVCIDDDDDAIGEDGVFDDLDDIDEEALLAAMHHVEAGHVARHENDCQSKLQPTDPSIAMQLCSGHSFAPIPGTSWSNRNTN